jgi:hypothetical protein
MAQRAKEVENRIFRVPERTTFPYRATLRSAIGFVFSPTLNGVVGALVSFLQSSQIRRIGFVAQKRSFFVCLLDSSEIRPLASLRKGGRHPPRSAIGFVFSTALTGVIGALASFLQRSHIHRSGFVA